MLYLEFVPVTDEASHLAPSEEHRVYMKEHVAILRREYEDMVFVSFPGDEKSSGGCIAAGRGFFHINSHGGAEPCPFSPYSDVNVRDTSLIEAMHSKLLTYCMKSVMRWKRLLLNKTNLYEKGATNGKLYILFADLF